MADWREKAGWVRFGAQFEAVSVCLSQCINNKSNLKQFGMSESILDLKLL